MSKGLTLYHLLNNYATNAADNGALLKSYLELITV